MQTQTRTAISALIVADGTIAKEAANRALAILEGASESKPVGRILKTMEAARRLGVTTKTLRDWSKSGALKPVYVPGRKLRSGYTEESVRALVEGRFAKVEG